MVKQRKAARYGRIVEHNKQTKRVLLAVSLALVGLAIYTLAAGYTHQEKQKVKLQETLKQLQLKQTELEKKNQDSLENQKKIDELTKQLQAKREAARALAEAQKAPVGPVQARVAISGDKANLLRQAGVSEAHIASAIGLIARESGWRLTATNSIGCIGLGQACPGGVKSVLLTQCPDWSTNAVCQLRVFTNYANVRYGGWNQAKAFSDIHNWY